MRTLLRRRIQEQSADQWQDSDLDALLNLGLQEVQKRLIHVNPMACAHIDRADIVEGQELYSWPAGFWYEFELRVLNPATGKYARIKREDEEENQKTSDSSSAYRYSHFGRWFRLRPVPSADLADGLEVFWNPTLEMSDDNDFPEIPVVLHLAVVVAAQLTTMGETGVAREQIALELESLASPDIISRWYHRSGADLDQIRVDVGGQKS